MEQTANLALPYIMPSQAQKHVTHNEALRLLDIVLQLAVADRDLATPPATPAEGDRYIVAAGGTDGWIGRDNAIAAWQDGGWVFSTPRPGWLALVGDEPALLYWSGSAWTDIGNVIAALQNLALLGIGTTADATNPFAAKLNKALWTARTAAEGGDGDLRYTLNKEADANVLSLLLQSDWSGRAEIGLVGDEDLTIKVSEDGSTWTQALVIDRADGSARFTAGSAAAPGIKVGDTGTGLYQTAGQLHGAVAGAEIARFTSAGIAIGAGFDPAASLHIQAPGAAGKIQIDGEASVNVSANLYNSAGPGPAWNSTHGRGTIAAPSPALQNDILGRFQFFGVSNSSGGAKAGGRMDYKVLAAIPSDSDMESQWSVFLCPPGSATVGEALRFEHASGLSMFGANPVIDQNRHLRLRSYTVATLPATATAGAMIYVSDGASNKRLAVGDGTNWRWPDGAIVS